MLDFIGPAGASHYLHACQSGLLSDRLYLCHFYSDNNSYNQKQVNASLLCVAADEAILCFFKMLRGRQSTC